MEYNFKLTKAQKALLLEIAANNRSMYIADTYKPRTALRDLGLIENSAKYPDQWRLTRAGVEYMPHIGYHFPHPKKLLNTGLSSNRLDDNPEERRFAEAWDAINQPIGTPGVEGPTLAHMMHLGDGWTIKEPAPVARTIAATVIQWLGSAVGRRFLHGLGYKYNERSEEE